MTESSERRIGVLGGMFDPPHNGHIGAARCALQMLGLHEVRLLPCGEPSHRPPPAATAKQRLEMLRLAAATQGRRPEGAPVGGLDSGPPTGSPCGSLAALSHPQRFPQGGSDIGSLLIDTMELERAGVCYTVDTLAELRARNPGSVLVFILGYDAFCGFTGWHEWQKILELAHLFVLPRNGENSEADLSQMEQYLRVSPADLFRTPSGGIYLQPGPSTIGDASSAKLRQRLAAGGDEALPIAPAVRDYIRRQRLYGAAAASGERDEHKSSGENNTLQLLRDALESRKGRDIACFDVRRLTEITDYMLVATGTSATHIKALSDIVLARCKAAGLAAPGIEGRKYAEWVLVDAGDVVVHIMSAPARQLYRLEELWDF